MITIVVESIAAFIAVYFFAVLLDAPKHSLFFTALTGGVGWFVHLIALERMDKAGATLIAGLTIAFMSQFFARRLKTPTTVYFLPGFIPIVPGEGVYRAVFAFIEENYSSAQVYLNEALLVAGSIAMSIFIVDSIFSLQMRLQAIRKAKENEEPL